jgi:hypothetical protein
MQDATIAAFWSAVAASCSALAALAAFTIQRRNLLEAVRPEMVLTGITRSDRLKVTDAPTGDFILFDGVKNVGKGSALHVQVFVTMEAGRQQGAGPHILGSAFASAIVAPGGEHSGQGSVILMWPNAIADQRKTIPFTVRVNAWDSRNRRHATDYRFVAMQLPMRGHNEIAPGLMLMSRRTRSQAVWWLRLMGWFARTPLVGRWFKRLAA